MQLTEKMWDAAVIRAVADSNMLRMLLLLLGLLLALEDTSSCWGNAAVPQHSLPSNTA